MREEAPPRAYFSGEDTALAVDYLTELVEILYPDPNPDVFTLASFKFAYKLHSYSLSETAVHQIEQSQRIIRGLDDYKQMGLNEFHIGLIYLLCAEVHAAEKQFDRARRQWLFVDETASLSLAHLGCGFAQHMTFQFEAAMASYNKSWQNLGRVRFTTPSYQLEKFRTKIEKYLGEAQTELRNRMRPQPASESDAEEAEETVAEETPSDPPSPEPTPDTPTVVEPPPTGPPPTEPEVAASMAEEPEPAAESTVVVPPPTWVNLSHDPMPIDGHRKEDGRYRWYEVEKRMTDEFMPQIHAGDWLLVFTKPEESDLAPTADEPVVIVSESESGSTIRLKPHPSDAQAHGRIFLRSLTEELGSFSRDTETGEVQSLFEQVLRDFNILGVVIGLWRPTAQVVTD